MTAISRRWWSAKRRRRAESSSSAGSRVFDGFVDGLARSAYQSITGSRPAGLLLIHGRARTPPVPLIDRDRWNGVSSVVIQVSLGQADFFLGYERLALFRS